MNEEKNFTSVGINCLITISATPLEKPYKYRGYNDLDLAHFI